jgi:cytosine/creatinine deaminase
VFGEVWHPRGSPSDLRLRTATQITIGSIAIDRACHNSAIDFHPICTGFKIRTFRLVPTPVLSGQGDTNFLQEQRMDPFMQAAIEEAEAGLAEGGIPIGSVIVHEGVIVGRGHNRRVQQGSAILHGEMDALERTGRRPAAFYRECTLYTTLSPCAMCSGTIVLYRIPRVVIGENHSFMGEETWLRSHGVDLEVLQDERCIALMREFMERHPTLWAEDIGE